MNKTAGNTLKHTKNLVLKYGHAQKCQITIILCHCILDNIRLSIMWTHGNICKF